jgi:hypothetical protein
MDQGRTLEMRDRRVVVVGKDEEVHGSILEGETCICDLLDCSCI